MTFKGSCLPHHVDHEPDHSFEWYVRNERCTNIYLVLVLLIVVPLLTIGVQRGVA